MVTAKQANAQLVIAPLVAGQPSIVNFTLTAAVTKGATSLSLTSVAPQTVKFGQALAFETATPAAVSSNARYAYVKQRVAVIAQETKSIGTTATTLIVKPVPGAIAANSLSPFLVGSMYISGMSEFPENSEPQTQSASGTDSGAWDETVTTKMNLTYNITAFIRDPIEEGALEILKINYSGDLDQRDVAMMFVRNTGEIFVAPVNLGGVTRPGTRDGLETIQIPFQVQGQPTWYAPYSKT